ncbi:MarR family transcriptional regulator [Nocardia panacis]|uniref:MarR family transcriptional regulator n=1 Tax=Nocardia panacis TaxID=2340916 RepID=A0A3A4K3P6_9NOCA|nr:MarR family transcriptional regulator [Nocardia panacis]RJO74853.1 MarR family transcriptional regulator [Nocardia panacis]
MSSDWDPVYTKLGEATQAYQAAVDDFDREMARLLGVNETDLRCLEALLATDVAAPGRLAAQMGLTTGSVTTMLDRLERLGYLTRSPHPTDRRKTLVRATALAAERVYALMGPFLNDAKAVLADYTADQLGLITEFLAASTANQVRHVQRLRESQSMT